MAERNPDSASGPPAMPQHRHATPATASAMKAFAHPLRMAMHAYLTDHGPATATTLARHLDESTGQTSYHLRQLERHGFVEEDAGRGTGRERWWKALGFSFRGDGTSLPDSASKNAFEMVVRTGLQRRQEALLEWMQRATTEPPEWVQASLHNIHTSQFTAAQSAALNAELLEVISRHAESAEADLEANPGAERRTVRCYVDTFPFSPD